MSSCTFMKQTFYILLYFLYGLHFWVRSCNAKLRTDLQTDIGVLRNSCDVKKIRFKTGKLYLLIYVYIYIMSFCLLVNFYFSTSESHIFQWIKVRRSSGQWSDRACGKSASFHPNHFESPQGKGSFSQLTFLLPFHHC